MLEFLKENFDSNDISTIIEEYEGTFPKDGKYYSSAESHTELHNKCNKLGVQFNYVKNYGGEGQGDSYWVVFSVTHNGETKLFRLDGWYASFVGHEFESYDDYYEVVPKEKTVIVYEKP